MLNAKEMASVKKKSCLILKKVHSTKIVTPFAKCRDVLLNVLFNNPCSHLVFPTFNKSLPGEDAAVTAAGRQPDSPDLKPCCAAKHDRFIWRRQD